MKHKIAVCGTGKISRSAATSLIEDLNNALNEDTEFLILISESQSEVALNVGEWAEDFDLKVVAVSSIEDLATSRQEDIWEYAKKNLQISKPSAIVDLLGENDHIVVAFDDKDEDTMRIITRAIQKGISVRDITMGLAPIVLDDGGSDPENDDDDDEDDIIPIADRTFELITDSNPLVEIRKALMDLVSRIDAIEERKTAQRVLAN
jgi:hypothetical protein